MRLPRMTTRRWMVVVAVVAILCLLEHRRRSFESLAAYHQSRLDRFLIWQSLDDLTVIRLFHRDLKPRTTDEAKVATGTRRWPTSTSCRPPPLAPRRARPAGAGVTCLWAMGQTGMLQDGPDASRADGSDRPAAGTLTGRLRAGPGCIIMGPLRGPEGSRGWRKVGGDGCGIVSSCGSWTVPRMGRHDMLGDGLRLGDEHPTTSEAGCLTFVRCVKGEYATRIGEVRDVEQGLTSNRRCKTWVREERLQVPELGGTDGQAEDRRTG